MLRIGLTGGIGSGKSTVATLFARHGIPVIDTDTIARELTVAGQPAVAEIASAFGNRVLNVAGGIDRARLRECVFHDTSERARLEAILHPRIRAEVARRLQSLGAPYCIVVVPLLIEAGFTDLVDRILVVDAGEDVRLQRTAAHTGMSEAEIRRIMSAQSERQARLQRADDVITNNSDMAHLERDVARLHCAYLALARSAGKD